MSLVHMQGPHLFTLIARKDNTRFIAAEARSQLGQLGDCLLSTTMNPRMTKQFYRAEILLPGPGKGVGRRGGWEFQGTRSDVERSNHSV